MDIVAVAEHSASLFWLFVFMSPSVIQEYQYVITCYSHAASAFVFDFPSTRLYLFSACSHLSPFLAMDILPATSNGRDIGHLGTKLPLNLLTWSSVPSASLRCVIARVWIKQICTAVLRKMLALSFGVARLDLGSSLSDFNSTIINNLLYAICTPIYPNVGRMVRRHRNFCCLSPASYVCATWSQGKETHSDHISDNLW